MNGGVSSKVFLGGLPWDITEEELLETFHSFGAVTIEWPNKDHVERAHGKGYAYAVFADSKSVLNLLQRCQREYAKDNEKIYEFFYGFSRRNNKTMQIIPWFTCDNEWAAEPSLLPSANNVSSSSPSTPPPPGVSTSSGVVSSSASQSDSSTRLTAFVGALHGQMTAMMLKIIFEEKFGKVLSVYLDTDKHKYPIGSGRVVFADQKAFRQAIDAGFVDVQTSHIFKRIQIDPYLEERPCSMCKRPGDYFCRSFQCFCYFCPECFYDFHAKIELSQNAVVPGHVPIARSTASARSSNGGSQTGPGQMQIPVQTQRQLGHQHHSHHHQGQSTGLVGSSGSSGNNMQAAAAAAAVLNNHRHFLSLVNSHGGSNTSTSNSNSNNSSNNSNSNVSNNGNSGNNSSLDWLKENSRTCWKWIECIEFFLEKFGL